MPLRKRQGILFMSHIDISGYYISICQADDPVSSRRVNNGGFHQKSKI